MTESTLNRPLPVRKSLRAKGWMATLGVLAYLTASGLYIAHERGKIFDTVEELEMHARHEKALAVTEAAILNAKMDVIVAASQASEQAPSPNELRLYMESCERQFRELESFDPSYALVQRAIVRSYQDLQAQPVRANWLGLREALSRAADDLEIRHGRLRESREALSTAYQRHYDAVTVESLALSLFGFAGFGAMAAWFFARLAGDVKRLETHAMQIVRGVRGVALVPGREDEIGQLMTAVNRMAIDLDEREKQIELDSQRRSHQDKMLTVGALASGIAHEVNNPLAAISGLAQELSSEAGSLTPQKLEEVSREILGLAQRAAQSARHLADASSLQPSELDWVDIHALLRRAVQLMGYDRRYRPFYFEIDADASLPAVHTSAIAVQQVLTQILALGCDAMVQARMAPAAQVADISSEIKLSTRHRPPAVEVLVQFPPVLDFSRSEVQRSLLLCRAVVEPLGARLAFGQGEGDTLRITLTLPIQLAEVNP